MTADCVSCSRCSINLKSIFPAGEVWDRMWSNPISRSGQAASFHNKTKAKPGRQTWILHTFLSTSLLKQTNLVQRHTFSPRLSQTHSYTSRNTSSSIILPVWRPSMERCGLRWKRENKTADSVILCDFSTEELRNQKPTLVFWYHF